MRDSTYVGDGPDLVASPGALMGTKVCPRCGATLFADMGTCYGCLYDFGRRAPSPEAPAEAAGSRSLGSSSAAPARRVVPGHLTKATPDDTIDLAGALEPARVQLRVITGDVEVSCQVPEEGLSVGRGPDNDLVLRGRAVSRHHLRILPDAAGLLVVDQGATNPALVDGVPVGESARASVGSVIGVCGTRLEVVEGRAPDVGRGPAAPVHGV